MLINRLVKRNSRRRGALPAALATAVLVAPTTPVLVALTTTVLIAATAMLIALATAMLIAMPTVVGNAVAAAATAMRIVVPTAMPMTGQRRAADVERRDLREVARRPASGNPVAPSRDHPTALVDREVGR